MPNKQLSPTSIFRMFRFRKAVKYATLGITGVAGVYLIKENDWEMSTIGVVRFGRAAFSVNIYFML